MKKIFFVLTALFLLGGQMLIAQKTPGIYKTKGVISPDSENEDRESDEKFTAIPAASIFVKKSSRSSADRHVSEVENGMKIVEDIVDKLIEREYTFSLLKQHKYMVNSCLGLKVSAGEFKIRFANPSIEVGNMGKVVIKLGIDKIKMSAVKIRTKPCTKPQHIPDPCHFGGKFEVGVEATDVSVKLTLDIIVPALEGSAGICYFAFGEPADITWKIGGFNMRPMPNVLDNVGKEMTEDGLNYGMADLVYNKFIELSKEVIPKYYSTCEQVYNDDNIKRAFSNIAGTGEDDKDGGSGGSASGDKWTITPNPAMKGVLGQVDMNFPEGVYWSIDFYSPPKKFLTNRSVVGRDRVYNVIPGVYNIQLNTIMVEGVPVEKGKVTKLKTGVLSVVSEGDWSIYDETQKKFQTSGNKPTKLALPVGNYQVKIGGQFFPVSIKEGVVLEI